jgi:hypothetical protein
MPLHAQPFGKQRRGYGTGICIGNLAADQFITDTQR